MSDRHPDPCSAFCETADALRALEGALACARNEAARILAGAYEGHASVHQALQATDLRNEVLVIAGLLGSVEAATAHALARPALKLVEAA